jgi:hypothetical protein
MTEFVLVFSLFYSAPAAQQPDVYVAGNDWALRSPGKTAHIKHHGGMHSASPVFVSDSSDETGEMVVSEYSVINRIRNWFND